MEGKGRKLPKTQKFPGSCKYVLTLRTSPMVPDLPLFDLFFWLYNRVKAICIQYKVYFEFWILIFSWASYML